MAVNPVLILKVETNMVYFISGLGSDERLFRNLELGGLECRFIKYLTPHPAESLSQYAARLLTQIDRQQEVILVGVSFGGIMAQEIARLLPCKKVIIISSVKSVQDFDWRIKLARVTKPTRLVPAKMLKWGASLTANYFFGINSKQDAAFLKELIKDADPELIKWSVHQVLCWQPEACPGNLVHLHGTQDRIFPGSKLTGPVKIIAGTHFMVANQASEISRVLQQEILNASGPAGAPGGQ